MSVYDLNFSNFHAFLQQNPKIVALASSSHAFNPVIARHFRTNRPDVALCRVQLEFGATWFDAEVRKGLRRAHAWHDSAYYLLCAGKFVAHHSGQTKNDAAIVGFALGTALAGKAEEAQEMFRRHSATPVIASFEAVLAKQPPALPAETPRDRDPHEVLGLRRGATEAEIDSAHRQKIREYHPDLVARAGPEMRNLAAARTVEINVARDALRPSKRRKASV